MSSKTLQKWKLFYFAKDVLNMFGKDVVAAVERRLKELNMSKGEFYEKSGISSATFSQWRTGTYEPSSEAIAKIEKCLGMTFEVTPRGHFKLFENLLVHGEQKQPAVFGELSADEINLIEAFRDIPDAEKQTFLRMIQQYVKHTP